MSQLNSQLRFNDDGTPRRRYELDQAPEGKAALTTTIALVLASAVALVKNVLFPPMPLEQPPLTGSASSDVHTAAVESGADQFAADGFQSPIQAFDDSPIDAPATAPRLTMATFRVSASVIEGNAFAAGHSSATSHLASNDNKALYGAAPGRGVQFGANDAIHLPSSGSETGLSAARSARQGGGTAAGDSGGDLLSPGQRVPADDDGEPGNGHDPTRPANRAPVVAGPASLGNRFINQVLVIGLSDLLVNATDADADRLSVSNITPSSGTLVANPEGGWNFMPDPQGQGDVTFSYTVSDGHASVTATATLTLTPTDAAPVSAMSPSLFARISSSAPVTEVRDDFGTPIAEKILLGAAPIMGTAGHDIITGTQGNDVIWAGDGDDIVDGGDGDDEIHGEVGNDSLTGGKGNDIVSGDDGDDTIVATIGDGDDVYDGGDGNDTLDLTAIATPQTAPGAPVLRRWSQARTQCRSQPVNQPSMLASLVRMGPWSLLRCSRLTL